MEKKLNIDATIYKSFDQVIESVHEYPLAEIVYVNRDLILEIEQEIKRLKNTIVKLASSK